MSTLALLSFSAFVVSVVVFAARAGAKTHRNPVDFYLGGRSQSAWRSAVASFAAAESGFVFLGLVGMAYTQGFVTMWILVGVLYGYLGTWLYMAPRLRRLSEDHNALTIPQIVGISAGRARSAIITYGAAILASALMMYVAVQFYAIGKTLHFVFGLPVWVGIVIGAILIVAYSMIGGLRSISHADVIQGCMMIASLAMISIVLGLRIANGGSLAAQLGRTSPVLVDPFGGATGWGAFFQVFFYAIIGLGLTGAPHYLRKFMATRPAVSPRAAGLVATSSVFALFLCALFTGFAGRILLARVGDPETVILLLGNKVLTGALAILFGLLVAGIFSAIGSTADSQLLEATATLTEDSAQLGVYRVIGSSPRRTIVIVGLLGIIFALLGNETVFNRTLTAWSILGATFGPQLLLGISGARLTGPGKLAGMVVATTTVLLWEFASPWARVMFSLAPAFVLGGLTTIVVSQLTLGADVPADAHAAEPDR